MPLSSGLLIEGFTCYYFPPSKDFSHHLLAVGGKPWHKVSLTVLGFSSSHQPCFSLDTRDYIYEALHANPLLGGESTIIIGCVGPNNRFAWSQSCEGFVNMTPSIGNCCHQQDEPFSKWPGNFGKLFSTCKPSTLGCEPYFQNVTLRSSGLKCYGWCYCGTKWHARVMEDQILVCMYCVIQGYLFFHWAWSVTLKGRLLAEGTAIIGFILVSVKRANKKVNAFASSCVTYDHVSSDGSGQSVHAMQSYYNNWPAQQIVIGCRVRTGVMSINLHIFCF
jgi:hypothetical protein